jgi:hypothetical protein
MTESAKALQQYVDSVASAFAPPDVRRMVLAVGPASMSIGGAASSANLDGLVETVVKTVGELAKAR